MSEFKIYKNDDFTASNHYLSDKKLSLKAVGLLSKMLSLPENWDYSINRLVAICKDNETSVKTALKELKETGYLVVKKLFPNETSSGRLQYVYEVYNESQLEGLKNEEDKK